MAPAISSGTQTPRIRSSKLPSGRMHRQVGPQPVLQRARPARGKTTRPVPAGGIQPTAAQQAARCAAAPPLPVHQCLQRCELIELRREPARQPALLRGFSGRAQGGIGSRTRLISGASDRGPVHGFAHGTIVPVSQPHRTGFHLRYRRTQGRHDDRSRLSSTGSSSTSTSITGDAVPPMFWLRDPKGNVLLMVEVDWTVRPIAYDRDADRCPRFGIQVSVSGAPTGHHRCLICTSFFQNHLLLAAWHAGAGWPGLDASHNLPLSSSDKRPGNRL